MVENMHPEQGPDQVEIPEGEDLDTAPRWGWGRWLLSIAASVILILLLAAPMAVWWIAETASGRAFAASQISRYQLENGLRFEIRRLNGSLLSGFEVVDLRVHDLEGVLASVPLVEVGWNPPALLRKTLDVRRLHVPDVRVLKAPAINPADPDEPLLPDFDIRIVQYDLPNIELTEAVMGRAETLSAAGAVDIRSGRLLLDSRILSASDDRLKLMLDAEPDGDRFHLDLDLAAPADGIVATLADLDQPLTMAAHGEGTWSRWRGRLHSDLGTGEEALRLAALAITGDDGKFRVRGKLQPGPLLPEAMQKLVEPDLRLDTTASHEDNHLAVRFLTSSKALSLTGHVVLDTVRNRLQAGRADLQLRDSASLHPDLYSRDLQLAVRMRGKLSAPEILWTIDARELAYGSGEDRMGMTGLSGKGTVQKASADNPLQTDFQLSAADFTGLPADVMPLLKSARLSGRMAITDQGTSFPQLMLKTVALDVEANAAMATDGRMTGKVKARVGRYEQAEMGAATLQANADFSATSDGRLSATGQFSGRALSIDNPSIRDFLGGLPGMAGRFQFRDGHALSLSALSFTSPELSLHDGRGSYDLDNGQLSFAGKGRSGLIGAFDLSAGGSMEAPHARLAAAAPGLGVDLTELLVELRPMPDVWLVTANALSPQGPLAARVRVQMAEDLPTIIHVDQAEFLGLAAQGRLRQTAAGPFAGRLALDGRGFVGTADLSDQNSVQQADLMLRARNARVPLALPVGVAGGRMTARLRLEEAGPAITGNWNLRGITRGELVLARLSGEADFLGLKGQARLETEGQSGKGLPFTVVSGLRSIDQGLALSLNGTAGRQSWKLERPAQLLQTDNGWQLQPARLLLPKGNLRIAGEIGKRNAVRLVFDEVDLSILDVLRGNMGFGGRLNGQFSYAADEKMTFPDSRLNLRLSGLQRASVTGLTVPVNIEATGDSDDRGIRLGARVSWEKHQLGRMVVKVQPDSGDTMFDRLMQGLLSGGIRYNGPVEPLWALVGSEGQSLSGAVSLGADFSGTLGSPDLRGRTHGKGLVYRNAMFGTEIRSIDFAGRFTDSRLRLSSFNGDANGGKISGSGYARFGADPLVNFNVDLDKAKLADSDSISVTLSGPLKLRGRGVRGTLSGDLKVDDARFQLVQMEQSEVPQLKVRREGVFANSLGESELSAESLALDVKLRADDRIRVEGMGLDSIWKADLRVQGTALDPLLIGNSTLVRGDFSFAGSDFDLTTGRLVFNGAPLDSAIDLRAETRAEDVVAVVNVSGTAARPEIHFSSTPSLPEDEILSRLLFGASVADLSVAEAVQLATAVAGLQSGTDTMGKLRRSVGLDRLRLVGENSETGMGSGLAIGKRLTRNVYAELLTDSEGNTLTTLQLTLSRIWSLFFDVSSIGESSVNLRYQREH